LPQKELSPNIINKWKPINKWPVQKPNRDILIIINTHSFTQGFPLVSTCFTNLIRRKTHNYICIQQPKYLQNQQKINIYFNYIISDIIHCNYMISK
jgi:hypothetical protein